MKKELKRTAVGIDDFEEMIEGDYYYVDKTLFIKDIIEKTGKVKLFTRPRRFGKSLNMSMLENFLKVNCNKDLFNNLEISKDRDFCDKYMGKYPVIYITLKDIEGSTFDNAKAMFIETIGREADRFHFLLNSDKLSDIEKDDYRKLINRNPDIDSFYLMSDSVLKNSIFELSYLLSKHYGKDTVILIDEYDVPLSKAYLNGYYDEMVDLIRSMFQLALKQNKYFSFAVLTGCLRVSKESIFTGMNNFKIYSITEKNHNESFGFTEKEVDAILMYYGLSDKKSEVKDWYDGYLFGDTEVYCPWDVVNYCSDLYSGDKDRATSYWANTSGNDIVRKFVSFATKSTSAELEGLMMGEEISKKINEDLTYRDLYDSIDNLWSILFATGYLTGRVVANGLYKLRIPNNEVQEIFVNDIDKWFEEKVKTDKDSGMRFFEAAMNGKPEEMEDVLSGLLFDSISIRDTFTQSHLRETFYHGFILGLLTDFKDVRSNPESGNGYSDIMILNRKEKIAAILELKYSDSDSEKAMEKCCRDAIAQIDDKKYALSLTRSGIAKKIIKYGISFNKKLAMVRKG